MCAGWNAKARSNEPGSQAGLRAAVGGADRHRGVFRFRLGWRAIPLTTTPTVTLAAQAAAEVLEFQSIAPDRAAAVGLDERANKAVRSARVDW
jgi:hypothetical protein